ncbi:hypothetical protein [Allosphingosinicella deserti]|uniref:Uncharacterized protein n=1 Tax=Allosphingosinicella deserti TaxID=2116704 RepID=A0A2P7QR92_9SPHN|nr:hypothetical protein [Sphingomonas deserti]PSJ40481.1 hypothetical protein C7I55_09090 [Sphingomonas deserti]
MKRLAYSLFILIAALPTLVPMAAVGLAIQGIVLTARGSVVGAIFCLAAAVYLALVMFAPTSAVPGARTYRALCDAERERGRATQLMRDLTSGKRGVPGALEARRTPGDPGDPAERDLRG